MYTFRTQDAQHDCNNQLIILKIPNEENEQNIHFMLSQGYTCQCRDPTSNSIPKFRIRLWPKFPDPGLNIGPIRAIVEQGGCQSCRYYGISHLSLTADDPADQEGTVAFPLDLVYAKLSQLNTASPIQSCSPV